MKKVLIIAYHFPPAGGGGVQRTLKFVKYLPSFGWQPIVLTTKNPDFDHYDESLLDDLPAEAIIERTFSLNFWRHYRVKRYGRQSIYETSKDNKKDTAFTINPFWLSWRIIKWVINNFLFVPDAYNGWFPFAFFRGLRIIRKEHINLIYATGNPWTSFVIARCLSAICKIPFVIDFRDPWVLSPYSTTKDRKALKHKIARTIEHWCVLKASYVINVNEVITKIFRKYYKNVDKGKFITITQGFDREDFNMVKLNKNNKFIISHVGTFYRHRTPDRLLEALNHLFNSYPDLKKKIKIKFIGITGSFADESIRNNHLEDAVKLIPYCSHKESIEDMCNSDLLVLIQANIKGFKAETPTGKLFEYLASGKRIMALVSKKNEAVQVLNNLNAGIAPSPENVELVAETILKNYKDWEDGKSEGRIVRDLSMYERKNLTRILAENFDRILVENQIT
jgi:glycosyltransferase involved in cell wall biosynthesis